MAAKTLQIGSAILTGLLISAAPADAASLAHPGAVVVQDGVYDGFVESSVTDPLPLYGPPSVSAGNSITFSPVNYSASVVGHQSDITAGALEFTFTADEGLYISTLSLFESGTFEIVGQGGVVAGGTLTVRYLDEQTQQLVTLSDPIHTSVPPSGDFPYTTAGTGEWFGSALIDFEAMGIQTGFLIVALDNNLIAAACDCGSATITKETMTINATVVPEPASLALMGVGVLLVARKRG